MARASSAGATYRRKAGTGGSSSAMTDRAGHCEKWASEIEANRRTCMVCLHVPRDAVAHSCGKLCCEHCWMQLGARPICPNCRSDTEGAVPAYTDRQDVLNLMVRCPRECSHAFRLGSKQDHLDKECARRPVTCPLCSTEVTADVLANHTKTECRLRKIKCPKCDESTTPDGLPDHQLRACPFRQVPCKLCGELVQWKDQRLHLTAEPGKHLEALLQESSRREEAEEGLRMEVSELRKEIAALRRQDEESAELRRRTEWLLREVAVIPHATKVPLRGCRHPGCVFGSFTEYCFMHIPSPQRRDPVLE